MLPVHQGVRGVFRPYKCGPNHGTCGGIDAGAYPTNCDCSDNWWYYCDGANYGEHTTITVHWQQRDRFEDQFGMQAENGICSSSPATWTFSEVEVFVVPESDRWRAFVGYNCNFGGGAAREIRQYGASVVEQSGAYYTIVPTLADCKRLCQATHGCDLIAHGSDVGSYTGRCYLRQSDQTGGVAHCAYDGALWVDSYLLDRWTAHPRRDCYAPNFGASAVLDANFYTESTLEECKLRCLETRGCNLITRGQGEGRATNCYLRTAPIPFDAGACALSTTTYDSHFLDLAATHFPGELDEAPVYTALPLKQCHDAGSIIIDPVGTGGTANHVALGTYRPCETVTYETYHPTVWYMPIGQGDGVGSSTGVTLEEAKAHCTAATQCNAFSYREDLGNAYYKNLRSSPGEPLSFINWYAGRTWTTQSLFNFYYEADSCMDASAKDCEAVCTANRNAGGTCNGIAYRPQWGGCYLYEFPEDLDQEDCADEIPTTTVNGASVHTSHNTIATYVREDLVRLNQWTQCARRSTVTVGGESYEVACGSQDQIVDAIKVERWPRTAAGATALGYFAIAELNAYGEDEESAVGDRLTLSPDDWASCNMCTTDGDCADGTGTWPHPIHYGSAGCDMSDATVAHSSDTTQARPYFIAVLKKRAKLSSVRITSRGTYSEQLGPFKLYYRLARDQSPVKRSPFTKMGEVNCHPYLGTVQGEWDFTLNSWRTSGWSGASRYTSVSMRRCKDLCAATPGCNLVSYDLGNSACFLRYTDVNRDDAACTYAPGFAGFYYERYELQSGIFYNHIPRRLASEPTPPLTASWPTAWTGADTTAIGYNYASGECTGLYAPHGFGLSAEYATQPGAYDGDFNGGWARFGEQRYLQHGFGAQTDATGALDGTTYAAIADGRIAASSASSDVASEWRASLQPSQSGMDRTRAEAIVNGGMRMDVGGVIYFPGIHVDHALHDAGMEFGTGTPGEERACKWFAPPSQSALGGGPLTVGCATLGASERTFGHWEGTYLDAGATDHAIAPVDERVNVRELYTYGMPKFLKPAGARMHPAVAGGEASQAGAAAHCVDGLDVLDDALAPPCYTDAAAALPMVPITGCSFTRSGSNYPGRECTKCYDGNVDEGAALGCVESNHNGLLDMYFDATDIVSVTVHNRDHVDATGSVERLGAGGGWEVWTADATATRVPGEGGSSSFDGWTLCFTTTDPTPWFELNVPCVASGAMGVRVWQKNNQGSTMNLNEIQVFAAGEGASVAWLEVDLGARFSVGGAHIALAPSASYPGLGEHEIRIGDVPGRPESASTVCPYTATSQLQAQAAAHDSDVVATLDEVCIGEGRYVWIYAPGSARRLHLKEVRPYAAPDASEVWTLEPDAPVATEAVATTCDASGASAVHLADLFTSLNLATFQTGDAFGRTNGGGQFARHDPALNRLTMQPSAQAGTVSNTARIDHGRAGCTAVRGWATLRHQEAHSVGEPMWLKASGGATSSRAKLEGYGQTIAIDLALDPAADYFDLDLLRATIDPTAMDAGAVSDIVDLNLDLCCPTSTPPVGMCGAMGFEHVTATSVGWSSSEAFGTQQSYAVTTGTLVHDVSMCCEYCTANQPPNAPPPPPPPTPSPPPEWMLCVDDCIVVSEVDGSVTDYSRNGECDDGEQSEVSSADIVPVQRCARGHDCTDCGSRLVRPPSPPPSPTPSPPPTRNAGLFLSLEPAKWCDALDTSLGGATEQVSSPMECYLNTLPGGAHAGVADEGGHIAFIPKLARDTAGADDLNAGYCAYWTASAGCRGYKDEAGLQTTDAWLLRASGPEHGIQLTKAVPGYDFAQHGCCSWVGAPLGPIDPDVVAAAGDAISTAHSTASAGYGALMAKHVRNAFDGRLGEWGTPEAALGWEPMPNYNMGLGDADHVSVEFGAKSGAAGASVAGMHGRGSINYFKWAQRIDDEPRTLLGQASKVEVEIHYYEDGATTLTELAETHWLVPVADNVRPCTVSHGARNLGLHVNHAHDVCPAAMPHCVGGYCMGGADVARVPRRRAADWQTVYHLKRTYPNVHRIKLRILGVYGLDEGVTQLTTHSHLPGAQEIEFGLDAHPDGTRRVVHAADGSSSPACAAACGATLGCVAYEVSGFGECALHASHYPTHPTNVRALEMAQCRASYTNLAWGAAAHGYGYNAFPTSGCFYAHAGSEASARAGYKVAGAPILNTIARIEGCVAGNDDTTNMGMIVNVGHTNDGSRRACALSFNGCHYDFQGAAPAGSTWRQYSDLYPGAAWCVPYQTTTGYDIHGATPTGATSTAHSVAACEAQCDLAGAATCQAITWNRATQECVQYGNAHAWDRYASTPPHVAWSCGQGMREYAWRDDDATCNRGGNLPRLDGASAGANTHGFTWIDLTSTPTYAAYSLQGANTLNGFRMGGPWDSATSQLKTFRVTLYDRPIANDTAGPFPYQRTADASVPDASHVLASEDFYGTCYSHDGHESVGPDGVDHGALQHPYEPWRRCVDGALAGQSDFDKHVYHFSKAYSGVKGVKLEPLTTWTTVATPGIRAIEFGYYEYGPHDATGPATLAAGALPPPPPPPAGRCDGGAQQVRGYSGAAPLKFGSVKADVTTTRFRQSAADSFVEEGEHSCSDAASNGWDLTYDLPRGDEPYEVELDLRAYQPASNGANPTVHHLPGAYASGHARRCYELDGGTLTLDDGDGAGAECWNAYAGNVADCAEWGADGTLTTTDCSGVGDGALGVSPSLVYAWGTAMNLTSLFIDNEPSVHLSLFGTLDAGGTMINDPFGAVVESSLDGVHWRLLQSVDGSMLGQWHEMRTWRDEAALPYVALSSVDAQVRTGTAHSLGCETGTYSFAYCRVQCDAHADCNAFTYDAAGICCYKRNDWTGGPIAPGDGTRFFYKAGEKGIPIAAPAEGYLLAKYVRLRLPGTGRSLRIDMMHYFGLNVHSEDMHEDANVFGWGCRDHGVALTLNADGTATHYWGAQAGENLATPSGAVNWGVTERWTLRFDGEVRSIWKEGVMLAADLPLASDGARFRRQEYARRMLTATDPEPEPDAVGGACRVTEMWLNAAPWDGVVDAKWEDTGETFESTGTESWAAAGAMSVEHFGKWCEGFCVRRAHCMYWAGQQTASNGQCYIYSSNDAIGGIEQVGVAGETWYRGKRRTRETGFCVGDSPTRVRRDTHRLDMNYLVNSYGGADTEEQRPEPDSPEYYDQNHIAPGKRFGADGRIPPTLTGEVASIKVFAGVRCTEPTAYAQPPTIATPVSADAVNAAAGSPALLYDGVVPGYNTGGSTHTLKWDGAPLDKCRGDGVVLGYDSASANYFKWANYIEDTILAQATIVNLRIAHAGGVSGEVHTLQINTAQGGHADGDQPDWNLKYALEHEYFGVTSITFTVVEAGSAGATAEVADGASCGVSEIEVGWDPLVKDARAPTRAREGYDVLAPPAPPPLPAAPIGHEEDLVAYWTFDSATEPLVDVVGGHVLEAISTERCASNDPRARWSQLRDRHGNPHIWGGNIGFFSGNNGDHSSVEACQQSCDDHYIANQANPSLGCIAVRFATGQCSMARSYDKHNRYVHGSQFAYYRDCSGYGAGWARMGGHGKQLRLDGHTTYVETSLSGDTADRARLHPSNTKGFTVCAIASSANSYDQCDGTTVSDTDCMPILVSNGLHPSVARATDATRRGWSLGMNRAMCRCDRGDQHMAAYGPHHTHVRLGGTGTAGGSAGLEQSLVDQALAQYDGNVNGLYDGVFTGRMSGGFAIENGVLGDVDDITWGAIDACQRDRSIDWARDDFCLEEAWPSDHASATPQAETWLPKLVCSVLDAPQQVEPKEFDEGCWVRGEDPTSAEWPGAQTSIAGVTPVAVASPHDATLMQSWHDCAHACLDQYHPYGTVDPDRAVYFNWRGGPVPTCECLAEPAYGGTHGDPAAAQPTIAKVDSPMFSQTTGRACAYRSGRVYFNGIEVAREPIDYRQLVTSYDQMVIYERNVCRLLISGVLESTGGTTVTTNDAAIASNPTVSTAGVAFYLLKDGNAVTNARCVELCALWDQCLMYEYKNSAGAERCELWVWTDKSQHAYEADSRYTCGISSVTSGYEAVDPANDENLFGFTLGGAARSHAGPNWAGTIDELAVWQRALTPVELASMHRRVMDEGKVVGEWAGSSPPSPAPAPPLLDARYSCCDGGNANPAYVAKWREYAGRWSVEHPTGDWQTPTESHKWVTAEGFPSHCCAGGTASSFGVCAGALNGGIECATVHACAAEGCLPVNDASYAAPPPPLPVVTPPSPSMETLASARRAPAPPAAHALETGVLLDEGGTFSLASSYGQRAACAGHLPVFQHLDEIVAGSTVSCNSGGMQGAFAASAAPINTDAYTISLEFKIEPAMAAVAGSSALFTYGPPGTTRAVSVNPVSNEIVYGSATATGLTDLANGAYHTLQVSGSGGNYALSYDGVEVATSSASAPSPLDRSNFCLGGATFPGVRVRNFRAWATQTPDASCVDHCLAPMASGAVGYTACALGAGASAEGRRNPNLLINGDFSQWDWDATGDATSVKAITSTGAPYGWNFGLPEPIGASPGWAIFGNRYNADGRNMNANLPGGAKHTIWQIRLQVQELGLVPGRARPGGGRDVRGQV